MSFLKPEKQYKIESEKQSSGKIFTIKLRNIDIIVLSVLVVVVAAIFISCYFLVDSSTDIGTIFSNKTEIDAEINEDYSAFIKSYSLPDTSSVSSDLSSISYITKDDYSIIKFELGYVDDTVKQLVETVYYSLSDIDDKEIKNMEENIKEHLSSLSSTDFCELTFSSEADYYIVKLNLSKLDTEENFRKLVDAKIFPIAYSHPLSLTVLESSLFSDGFIREYK